ncbi:MAG: hypothetical protein K6A44_06435 [bacterium]|nr:hypothetical protein [bacterium]
MNINAISNMNFRAHMQENDYHMEKIEEYLFDNHRMGADEILDFRSKLANLPAGQVEIDEFVQHAGRSYVFGTVYPNCNHEKPFVVETADTENLLDEIVNAVSATFKEKSRHPECPICNPFEK